MKNIGNVLRWVVVAGWVIFVVAFILMRPWTGDLGVTRSAARAPLTYIYAFVACVPTGVYFMYLFAQRPEWNVMPGRYIKGMKVNVASPYTYVAIGVVGALFTAAAAGDAIRLDVQAMVIAASAALFGGVISFWGLLVGQILGRLFIFPDRPLLYLLPHSFLDAAIWAVAGYCVYRFVYSRDKGTGVFKAFFIAWIISEPVHQLFWFVPRWIENPFEAAWTTVLNGWVIPQPVFPFLPYWILSAFVFVPVGYFAGYSVRKMWAGGEDLIEVEETAPT